MKTHNDVDNGRYQNILCNRESGILGPFAAAEDRYKNDRFKTNPDKTQFYSPITRNLGFYLYSFKFFSGLGAINSITIFISKFTVDGF